MSRREALKLTRIAMLLTAGLGVGKIVDAQTGEVAPGLGQARAKTANKNEANYVREKQLPIGSYITTMQKVTKEGLELVSIVPITGDVEAALKDPEAMLMVKLTRKPARGIIQDKLKDYATAEILLSKSRV